MERQRVIINGAMTLNNHKNTLSFCAKTQNPVVFPKGACPPEERRGTEVIKSRRAEAYVPLDARIHDSLRGALPPLREPTRFCVCAFGLHRMTRLKVLHWGDRPGIGGGLETEEHRSHRDRLKRLPKALKYWYKQTKHCSLSVIAPY